MSDYQAGQEPKQRVVITRLDGKGNPKTGSLDVVEAQFNPTSLQYSINNTLEQGSGKQKSRKVGDSTGKLSMELVYDTTDTGTDVRITTQNVAMLMRPEGKGQLTPVVRVTWGIFKFEGVLDSYRETLDFFSTDGVPLRASLSLSFSTVAKNNATPSKVFAFGSAAPKDKTDDDKKDGTSKDSKTVETSPEKATPAEIGKMFGDPVLAKQIAKKNGVEDIRNGSDAGEEPYEVVDEPQLDEPLAFAPSGGGGLGADLGAGAGASAGASFGAAFGASAGLSAGVSGGFGASAGASFGANASAGFGASAGGSFSAGASGSFSASAGGSFSAGASGSFSANAGGSFSAGASGSFSANAGGSFSANASGSFSAGANASFSADGSYTASASYSAEASYSYRAGGQASAGVSAVDGAFAALRPRPSQSTQRIDLDLLLPGTPSRVLTVDAPEAFGPGGIVVRSGSSSFDVDVGASFSLSERITFED